MALFAMMFAAFMEAKIEIMAFLFAICVHAMLFGRYRIRSKSSESKQVQDGGPCTASKQRPLPPSSALAVRLARQMLRQGADALKVQTELNCQLQALPSEDACDALAGLLEHVGKAVTPQLLSAVRAVLVGQSLQQTAQLQTLLLQGYLCTGLHHEFNELFAQVRAEGRISPATAVLALRAAVAASDLERVLGLLDTLASVLKGGEGPPASAPPQQLLQNIAQLAGQRSALPVLLGKLRDARFFTAGSAEAMLAEAEKREDTATLRETEALARSRGLEFTEKAYGVLVRKSSSAADAKRLFAEAVEKKAVGKSLLMVVADAARAHRSQALAGAAIGFPVESPSVELAAALLHLAATDLAGADPDAAVLHLYQERLAGVNVLASSDAGRLVAEAALRRNQPEVLRSVLAAAGEGPRQVALLKHLGAEYRLSDALRVFEACPVKTNCLYNTLLDTCIKCKDMEAAERVMREATSAGLADVVTYNTVIKRHVQRGDLAKARGAIAAMRAAGGQIAPNIVSFNELIDAVIQTDAKGAWGLIEEMRAYGIQPNSVTASILLKGIQRGSRPAEVERALRFVDSVDGDEVMLSSVCEACIRAGRCDLLKERLEQLSKGVGIQLSSAHAFGSFIRAHGFVQDIDGAWGLWHLMRSRGILPTSITVGCMVEALVSNGDSDGGHGLIRQLLAEPQLRPLVNAVIYCSVLKGFCHQKRFDRVWAVYGEMRDEKFELSIATYNALIDACARSLEMSRVQPLLEEMSQQGIAPNVITYSTILKGYCQEGRLSMAFAILKEMRESTDFQPDEIVYNTLIDGCARKGLYDQGMALLEEMQKAGVRPGAFTLSVLLKLVTRSGRPEEAFKLCERLSHKHRIRLNIYVYNNLISACTSSKSTQQAYKVFDQMLQEGIRPDGRTYALLLRACLGSRAAEEAAGLLRAAAGLPGALPRLLVSGSAAALRASEDLPTEVVSEALEMIGGPCKKEDLALELLHQLQRASGPVRVRPGFLLQGAARAGSRGL